MAVTAIVRVSFQSSVMANRAANKALVGHPQDKSGAGPFERVNTSLLQCIDAPDADVTQALAELGAALVTYADKVDFVSISLTRKKAVDDADDYADAPVEEA